MNGVKGGYVETLKQEQHAGRIRAVFEDERRV